MNRNDQFGPIFALAARFATEIAAMNLPLEVIQGAKEASKEDPLWKKVRGAFLPEEMPMSAGLTLKNKGGEEGAQVAPTLTDGFSIPRIQILTERPKPCAQRSIDEQVTDLKQMYQALRWTWTEHGLVVPERQRGFDRLLVFANTQFTNNQLFDVCSKSFQSWLYVDDLDSAALVDTDERHPSRGVYAIWVKDKADSDYDLRDISAIIIADRGQKTVTFLEREFLESVYHRETGGHLDTRTSTLCSGSRSSDGNVPCTDWGFDKFRVGFCNPGNGNPYIRARQVVAL